MTTVSASPPRDDTFTREYATWLRAYVAGGGEAALAMAYDLGRRAISDGGGLVELVLAHHAALAGVVSTSSESARAAAFLAEVVAPFEMTHRGFREAAGRLWETNRTLQERNAELEQTARDLRAAKDDVERANGELEAFSYSVSHDLRAPLRAIDGFSQALLEDHGPHLAADARRLLERVRAGAKRMGQLIDDLLYLARVGHGPLVRQRLDVSSMVRQVVDELRRTHPVPPAVVEVAPAIEADADEGLVRIVLENLLGNAWKFSGKRDERRIAFGVDADARAYFVKDNGAGFDMAQGDRLFKPFQRLHSQAEFSGTGIGLATVRRVVERHQGRIWVKSAPDQGSTVYFTLSADSREPAAEPPPEP